jgi:hypothetical protein
VPPAQNYTIFNQSRNITNVYYNNSVINNYGPQVATLQQKLNQPIPQYNINYLAQTKPGAAFRSSTQGNQLQVLAPPAQLNKVASVQPPVKRELGAAQAERGWQNIPPAQQAALRQKLGQNASVPANLPPKDPGVHKPQFIAKGGGKPGQPAGPPAPIAGGSQPVAPNTKVQPGVTPKVTTDLKPTTPNTKLPSGPGEKDSNLAEQQKLEAERKTQERTNAAKEQAQKLEKSQGASQTARQAELQHQQAEQQHASQQQAQTEKLKAEQTVKKQEKKPPETRQTARQLQHAQPTRLAEASRNQGAQEQARIVAERQHAAASHPVRQASYQAPSNPHPATPPPHPAAAPHPAPPPHPAAHPPAPAPAHAASRGGGHPPASKNKKDEHH